MTARATGVPAALAFGYPAAEMTMRTFARSLSLLTLAAAFVGCGPSPSEAGSGSTGTITTSGGGESGGGSSGTGTSETPTDDTSALLVDMVAPRLCDQLRSSFVGLPGDGGHEGPAAGTDPTVGRWWIRECSASVSGDMLSLRIAGTGWTWVDRESMGFQVRQYLRFDSAAAFTARMEVGYDRTARIVTVWMRPEGEVVATVEPRGLVEAHATNALSGMLGGLLDLTGSGASDRARATVAEEGSQRLRERFGAGFTVTYAMDTEQMDFMVGALDRGIIPERPYAAETGVVWSVNQRLTVYPGGLDVLGPLPTGGASQAVDLELEEGEAVTVDAVCLADFERFYDLVLQGAPATAPTGTRVANLTALGARRVVVPAMTCPTLLLLTPRAGTTLPIRMRTRICAADAPTATAAAAAAAAAATTGGTTAGGTTTTAPTVARPVRIRITGMTLATLSTTGSRWDTIGSEPDGLVVIASIPGHREIERFLAPPDVHEMTLDHPLPGLYHPEDLPLRFSVYDDDITADELIGVAELTAGSTGDVVIELRSAGDVPQTMGSIRLNIQRVD
jgi:hypothetical protein